MFISAAATFSGVERRGALVLLISDSEAGGSTRFKDQFLEAQKRLTLEGNIVINVGGD